MVFFKIGGIILIKKLWKNDKYDLKLRNCNIEYRSKNEYINVSVLQLNPASDIQLTIQTMVS